MKTTKCGILLLYIFLVSCQGSDRYQGDWKAMDNAGHKFEIKFSPTTLAIRDSVGHFTEYPYTQNSIHFENSVETYGIEVEDGRGYKIHFPKKDKTVGLILDENDVQTYTIGRDKHITYEEIYSLN